MEIIPERVIRSKRKTLALIVAPDATLTVRAPYFVTPGYIKRFIQQKADWIFRQQQRARKTVSATPKTEIDIGGTCLYQGNRVILQAGTGISSPELRGFFLIFPSNENLKNQLLDWYKLQALAVLQIKMEYFKNMMRVDCAQPKLSNAKTRWGSCSPQNSIKINWRLIMAPPEILDYVIVHELAHIKEKNHSNKFWVFVSGFCPDYKTHRKWLRDNGHSLNIT